MKAVAIVMLCGMFPGKRWMHAASRRGPRNRFPSRSRIFTSCFRAIALDAMAWME